MSHLGVVLLLSLLPLRLDFIPMGSVGWISRGMERTEVEVLFEPAPSGTLVTIQHRGWAAVRPDHPARHNLDVPAFIRMMGLWWGDQLTALREFVAT